MKKMALVLFLLFFMCVPSMASDLVFIEENDVAIIQIDPDTIVRFSAGNEEFIIVDKVVFPKGAMQQKLADQFSLEYPVVVISHTLLFYVGENMYQITKTEITYAKLGTEDLKSKVFDFGIDVNAFKEFTPQSAEDKIYQYIN